MTFLFSVSVALVSTGLTQQLGRQLTIATCGASNIRREHVPRIQKSESRQLGGNENTLFKVFIAVDFLEHRRKNYTPRRQGMLRINIFTKLKESPDGIVENFSF